MKVKIENLVEASKQILFSHKKVLVLIYDSTFFLFTDDGFILISGFTKTLCSPWNPLLKVNEVTTEHQKLPKISENWIKNLLFLPKGQTKPQPKAEALHSDLLRIEVTLSFF